MSIKNEIKVSHYGKYKASFYSSQLSGDLTTSGYSNSISISKIQFKIRRCELKEISIAEVTDSDDEKPEDGNYSPADITSIPYSALYENNRKYRFKITPQNGIILNESAFKISILNKDSGYELLKYKVIQDSEDSSSYYVYISLKAIEEGLEILVNFDGELCRLNGYFYSNQLIEDRNKLISNFIDNSSDIFLYKYTISTSLLEEINNKEDWKTKFIKDYNSDNEQKNTDISIEIPVIQFKSDSRIENSVYKLLSEQLIKTNELTIKINDTENSEHSTIERPDPSTDYIKVILSSFLNNLQIEGLESSSLILFFGDRDVQYPEIMNGDNGDLYIKYQNPKKLKPVLECKISTEADIFKDNINDLLSRTINYKLI